MNKSIHLDGWFQEWDDINLAWNKSEYDDIVDIRLPPKYIWKPDLLMYNRCDKKMQMQIRIEIQIQIYTHETSREAESAFM